MPVTYEVKESLLRMEFDGDYEPEDVIETFLAAMADPKCPPRVAMLVDVRRSSALGSRTTDEIRHIAEYLGPYRERIGGRVAVIADTALHYGLSRMGSVYSSGVGVDAQIFRDPESALQWLGSVAPPIPG